MAHVNSVVKCNLEGKTILVSGQAVLLTFVSVFAKEEENL